MLQRLAHSRRWSMLHFLENLVNDHGSEVTTYPLC